MALNINAIVATDAPTGTITTTVAGSPALSINTGGTLTLNNTSVNNTNRINPNDPVVMSGGTFNFIGNATAASSQTFNAASGLILNPGNATINVTSNGANAVLTWVTLTRNPGATVNFTAGPTNNQTLNATTNQLVFTTAPTLVNGVLKGASTTDATTITGVNTTGFNLATYTTGIVAYGTGGAAGTYTTLPTTGTGNATTNYIAITSTALAGSFAANSLLLVGPNTAVTAAAGTILTLGSATQAGVVASTGTGDSIASSLTLALGTAEGDVLTGSGATTTIASPITGTGGLSFGGSGTLNLAGPNSDTGTNTISSGTLNVVANNLGTGNLNLVGGTLTAGSALTISGTTTLNNTNVTIGGSSGVDFTGLVTLAGLNDTLNVTDTAPSFIGGVIQDAATSPARSFSITGTGTLELTGSNTYNAFTNALGGTLNVQNSLALGGIISGGQFIAVISGTGATEVGNIVTITTNAIHDMFPGQTVTIAGVGVAGYNITATILSIPSASTTATTFTYYDPTAGLAPSGGGVATVFAQTGSVVLATNGPISAGVVVGAGATVQLQGGISIAKSINVNGGTIESVNADNVTVTTGATFNASNYLGGDVLLGAPSTFNVDANLLTLLGSVSGAADLTKNGGGTLVLAGTNSYTGQTNINAGAVQLTTPTTQNNTNSNVISPLGAVTGSVIVSSGATLQLNTTLAAVQSNNNLNNAVVYASKTLVLNGQGLGAEPSGLLEPTGALENIANQPNIPGTSNFPQIWTGNIVLNTPNVVLSNIAGTNIGTGQISVTNNNPNNSPPTITGVISGTGDLTKVGTGSIALGAAETYTGATTVTVGTLVVNGVGQILNTSGVTLNPNAVLNAGTITATQTMLTLDNTANVGASSSPFQALVGGFSTTGITISGRLMNGANPANLTLDNGVFNFLGNNTPGVLSQDALGTVTVNSGASYFNQTSGGAVGASAVFTINTLTRVQGGTLTFLSGGIANINASIGSSLNKILINTLGSGVSLFNTSGNSNILPWATIGSLGGTGPGGANIEQQYDFVTLIGTAPFSVGVFTNYKTTIASAGANDIVRLVANETLTQNKVVGGIMFAGTTTGASITITQANYTLGVASGAIMAMGNNTLTISGGTVDIGTAEGILDQNDVTITVNSSLTGTGGLTLTNTYAGVINLNAANSYTGTTTVNGSPISYLNQTGIVTNINVNTSQLNIGNVSAFGNGLVVLNSSVVNNNTGTVNLAIGNPILFNNAVVSFGNSNSIVFTGPITLTGNNQIAVSSSNIPIFFGGVVSGTGSLSLPVGNSLVMENPNNTYSGGTNIGNINAGYAAFSLSNGQLQVTSSSILNSSGVLVSGPLGTGAVNFTAGVLQNANSTANSAGQNQLRRRQRHAVQPVQLHQLQRHDRRQRRLRRRQHYPRRPGDHRRRQQHHQRRRQCGSHPRRRRLRQRQHDQDRPRRHGVPERQYLLGRRQCRARHSDRRQ